MGVSASGLSVGGGGDGDGDGDGDGARGLRVGGWWNLLVDI